MGLMDFTVVGLADWTGDLVELNAVMKVQLWMAADDLSSKCTDIYQKFAPKRTGQFAASITGSAVKSDNNFLVTIDTPMVQLEMWLREGTGMWGRLPPHMIHATHRRPNGAPGLMGPIPPVGPRFLYEIAGMKPNPWETYAYAESWLAAQTEGNLIAGGLDLVVRK